MKKYVLPGMYLPEQMMLLQEGVCQKACTVRRISDETDRIGIINMENRGSKRGAI